MLACGSLRLSGPSRLPARGPAPSPHPSLFPAHQPTFRGPVFCFCLFPTIIHLREALLFALHKNLKDSFTWWASTLAPFCILVTKIQWVRTTCEACLPSRAVPALMGGIHTPPPPSPQEGSSEGRQRLLLGLLKPKAKSSETRGDGLQLWMGKMMRCSWKTGPGSRLCVPHLELKAGEPVPSTWILPPQALTLVWDLGSSPTPGNPWRTTGTKG